MRKIMAIIILWLCASSVFGAPQTFTIAESGGDYSSLETAMNANEGDLTGNTGGSITFRIEGAWTSSDSLRVNVHNYTMGVSSGILITAVGDARTNGVFSQSRYRLCPNTSGTDTFLIAQSGAYLIVDGLQIGLNAGNQYWHCIRDQYHSGNTVTVQNCYLYKYTGTSGAGYQGGIYMGNSSSYLYAYNNIIHGFQHTTYNCGIRADNAGTNVTAYNNTISSCAYGIIGNSGLSLYKNNLCYNNSVADYSGTFSGQSTNNLSGDGTAPAFNTYYTTATVTFQAGTYLIDSTDTGAKDLGADLSADTYIPFNTSINGLTRPQGTAYDIGAGEVSQSAPPSPAPSVPFLPQVMIWEN